MRECPECGAHHTGEPVEPCFPALITADFVIYNRPCWTKARVRALFGDRVWSPQDVLRLTAVRDNIWWEERLWVVTRPGAIKPDILRRAMRWVALARATGKWRIPRIVAAYLKTGDPSLRREAHSAALAVSKACDSDPDYDEVVAGAAQAAVCSAAYHVYNPAYSALVSAETSGLPVEGMLINWLDRADAGEALPRSIARDELP